MADVKWQVLHDILVNNSGKNPGILAWPRKKELRQRAFGQ